MVAIDEVTLGADPELARAIRRDRCHAGMRLDVALVRLLGAEGALDDDVGVLEARVHVAVAELGALGDVGGLLRLRLDAFGEHLGVHQRGVGLHRLIHVGDVGEDLVVHLDELQRGARGGRVDGGHGGHGMAVILGDAACHAVFEDVIHRLVAGGVIGKIGRRDDGLHARQLLGLGRVDLLDLRVRMGRTQNEADELARQVEVRAVARAARDLVEAVRAQRARADALEVGLRQDRVMDDGGRHMVRRILEGMGRGAFRSHCLNPS